MHKLEQELHKNEAALKTGLTSHNCWEMAHTDVSERSSLGGKNTAKTPRAEADLFHAKRLLSVLQLFFKFPLEI